MTSRQWMSTLAALAIIAAPAPATAKVEIVSSRSAALSNGSTFSGAQKPAIGARLADAATSSRGVVIDQERRSRAQRDK